MAGLRIGKRQTKTTAPTHVGGVNKGGDEGSYASQTGHLADGRSTSERSTGVNPSAANPIDPRMPNLSPP
jgi:hypothetical protein